MKNRTLEVGLFVFLLVQSAFMRADVHQAASCSQADVLVAIALTEAGSNVVRVKKA